MSDKAWDFYERLGTAIGDHLGRLAIAIVMAFAVLFGVGLVA